MSDRAKFIESCELELERLKEEETFLKELLSDVQKQLDKYKVEGLHMSHISTLGDDYNREKVVEEIQVLDDDDSVEIVNQNKLDLELRNDDDFVESEESEFSD